MMDAYRTQPRTRVAGQGEDKVEAIMGSKPVETAPEPFAPRPEHERAPAGPAPGAGVPDLREALTPRELSPRLPDDFTRADMRALTERIYALATQI